MTTLSKGALSFTRFAHARATVLDLRRQRSARRRGAGHGRRT